VRSALQWTSVDGAGPSGQLLLARALRRFAGEAGLDVQRVSPSGGGAGHFSVVFVGVAEAWANMLNNVFYITAPGRVGTRGARRTAASRASTRRQGDTIIKWNVLPTPPVLDSAGKAANAETKKPAEPAAQTNWQVVGEKSRDTATVKGKDKKKDKEKGPVEAPAAPTKEKAALAKELAAPAEKKAEPAPEKTKPVGKQRPAAAAADTPESWADTIDSPVTALAVEALPEFAGVHMGVVPRTPTNTGAAPMEEEDDTESSDSQEQAESGADRAAAADASTDSPPHATRQKNRRSGGGRDSGDENDAVGFITPPPSTRGRPGDPPDRRLAALGPPVGGSPPLSPYSLN